jgi:hypothetical protein
MPIAPQSRSSSSFLMRSFTLAAVLFGLVPWCGASGRTCVISTAERDVYRVLLSENVVSDASASQTVYQETDGSTGADLSISENLKSELIGAFARKLASATVGPDVILASPAADFSSIIPRPVGRELDRNFRALPQGPCRIPVLRGIARTTILPSSEVWSGAPGADPDLEWRKFHKRFGEHAWRVSLSRVAFDTDHKHAMVHMSSGFDSTAGGGELCLLVREENHWKVVRRWVTWTT